MKFLLINLILLFAGCSIPEEESAGQTSVRLISTEHVMTLDTWAKWQRSCALCHVAGEGGAPRMGDPAAWRSRLLQGQEKLLENTVIGLNRMPPLGYCMDCSEEDFISLIIMMAGE